MARRLMQAAVAALVVVVVSENVGWLQVAARSGGQPVGLGSIAAGRAHTLMAMPDGRVFAWGAGGRGQIGDGLAMDRWTPTLVPGLSDVVSVAAGAAHSVAVTKTGHVYAWGANSLGRLGDGTTKRRLRPVQVEGLQEVTMVATGRAHTLALTANGDVFEWGRTNVGEPAKGKKKSTQIPAPVPGLSDIVAIAAGDAHSLAVSRDGHLFAWGNNQFSALGDGTTKDRARPVMIALTDVVAVAGGGSHSLALLRNGAVYAWGRGANGELGTGSTKVASTPKLIPGLQASAIAAGGHFSAAVRSDGRVAAWGANGSGQLGSLTAPRELRPVLVEGLESIVSLALGDAHAIAVTKTGDVRVWGEGDSGRLGTGSELDHAAPLEVISDIPNWGGESGPPQPPLIAPITGIYPAAQTVTLSAAATTDVIRFTLDGSDPDETSTVYTSPLTVSTSLTVVARSFSTSGEASVVRAETYTIDTTAPSIVASTSPALQAGWMTVPVTVSFECADDIGIASCPEAVTVDQDGATQVSGTAVDRAGHQTTTTVAISVDIHPPVLSIFQPVEAASISAEQVAVTAHAFDPGSGVVQARCNGETAAIVDGAIGCLVSLSPGRNEIILSATDALGHNASAAVQVTRAGGSNALTLTPATRGMVVNERATLALRDDFGALVEQALWSTSDADIVELSETDPPELTALVAGRVTITAEKDGLTATATIDVSAGLAAGDVRWSLPPLPDLVMQPPIFTHRVDASVPHMFTVETQNDAQATLRAVTSDGEVLWQQRVPGTPLMGDSFGGVLVGVPLDPEFPNIDYRALLHAAGGGVRSWRYDSPGMLNGPAQARDGTIYVRESVPGTTEWGQQVMDKYALVLNGATGALISRLMLPRESDEFISAMDGQVLQTTPPMLCRSSRLEAAPQTIGPIAGSDGRGYLVVRRLHIERRADCNPPKFMRPDRTIEMGVDLVILAPNAAPQTINLYSTSCTGVAGTSIVPCDVPVRLFQLMPDAIGGTLVTFERVTHVTGSLANIQRSLTRVGADGAVVEQPVGRLFTIELIGQDGVAVVWDGDWKAVDVTTGTNKWVGLPAGHRPMGARPDGGVALLDLSIPNGDLKMMDGAGTVLSAQPFVLDWKAVHQFGDWLGRKGGQLVSTVGEFADATRFSQVGGNAQRQLTVRRPGMGLTLKSQQAAPIGPFQHVAIKIAPINQNWMEQWYLQHSEFIPKRDLFGNLFITLGAGLPNGEDTTINCGVPGLETLVSDTNRDGDLNKPADRWKELPVAESDEAGAIDRLLQWHDRYKDTAPYACFPDGLVGLYNSNSYAHSLLIHAGVAHDEAPPKAMTPGWMTILPTTQFRPD